ncbi:MAG: SLC13 family permease [Candidatus Thorarchaeota archaeon]
MSVSSFIPAAVLLIVFLLIVFRRIGGFRVKIWQAMLLGAVLVLLTGQISFYDAALSINLDVMLFLFGMFIVGYAMEASGYLHTVSWRMFGRAGSVNHLVLLVLGVMGIFSAILMNDTIAIIGTPIMITLSKRHDIPPKLMLLTLAFAVTTGSVLSPIGNPQNLLVATVGQVPTPFVSFLLYLSLPTLISFVLAYIFLRVFFRNDFSTPLVNTPNQEPVDESLARLSKISITVVLVLIVGKVLLLTIAPWIEFRLTYIALIAALPIILLSPRRASIVKNIDWETLVFFAAMFVLMSAVWASGVFQTLLEDLALDMTGIPTIMFLGLILSQLISNVPFVALYLPLLVGSGVIEYLVLAASSTIAGNMLILGAASNIIIIQNAEKQGATLSFLDFAKIGIPLTLLQLGVYSLFFLLIS